MTETDKNYNPEINKDCYSYVLKRNDAITLLSFNFVPLFFSSNAFKIINSN